MNTEFVSYIRQRVETTTKKLQAVHDQIQKLNTDRENLTADLEGYKRALAAETRDSSPQEPTPINIVIQDTLQLDDSIAHETINKAEFARTFIRGRALAGVTPGDIFQSFHDSSIKITKAYVYSLVQRLKEQGVIRQKRGRWFPVEPEASNGHLGHTA